MARKVDPRVPDAQATHGANKALATDAPSNAEVLLCDLRAACRQVDSNRLEIVQDPPRCTIEGDGDVMPFAIHKGSAPVAPDHRANTVVIVGATDREIKAAKCVNERIKAAQRQRVLGAAVTPADDRAIRVAVAKGLRRISAAGLAAAGLAAAGRAASRLAASGIWRWRRWRGWRWQRRGRR